VNRSAEVVYSRLSAGLDPALTRTGMQRLSRAGYPSWRRQDGGTGISTLISLQIDSKATDPFSGGGFRVELERSKNRLPARGLNGRALFFQLLRDDELAILVSEQNRIIDSLPTPTIEQIELYPAGAVRDQYLKYFEPQRKFDVAESWLRYHTDDDLAAWTRLFAPLVAAMIERAESNLKPDVLHLGEGSLLDK
jgi:hypothetical protein